LNFQLKYLLGKRKLQKNKYEKDIRLMYDSLGWFWACQSPLEGFELGFKDPIEKAKIEIRFYNPSGTLPSVKNQFFWTRFKFGCDQFEY
jgi:hypothetical protein